MRLCLTSYQQQWSYGKCIDNACVFIVCNKLSLFVDYIVFGKYIFCADQSAKTFHLGLRHYPRIKTVFMLNST